MITDQILQFAHFIAHLVLAGLPHVPVPDWLSAATGAIAQVFSVANSMSVWVPMPLIMTIAGALLAVNLVGLGITGARIAVSLFTGGGGST